MRGPGEVAVNFGFTSEQESLRSELQRFLAERSPMAEVRRVMETDLGFFYRFFAYALRNPEEHIQMMAYVHEKGNAMAPIWPIIC